MQYEEKSNLWVFYCQIYQQHNMCVKWMKNQHGKQNCKMCNPLLFIILFYVQISNSFLRAGSFLIITTWPSPIFQEDWHGNLMCMQYELTQRIDFVSLHQIFLIAMWNQDPSICFDITTIFTYFNNLRFVVNNFYVFIHLPLSVKAVYILCLNTI